jgi:hypothetical protein
MITNRANSEHCCHQNLQMACDGTVSRTRILMTSRAIDRFSRQVKLLTASDDKRRRKWLTMIAYCKQNQRQLTITIRISRTKGRTRLEAQSDVVCNHFVSTNDCTSDRGDSVSPSRTNSLMLKRILYCTALEVLTLMVVCIARYC